MSMTDDAYVRHTQAGMRSLGFYGGPVDGDPGKGTLAGFDLVMAALRAPAMPVEPIVLAKVRVRGAAKPIEDLDLPRIGAQIGVGEDEIHAVMDVEAAGRGFDPQGRVKMLFEPHIFYRELRSQPMKQAQAEREGLAYPNWKRSYPPDSYPRFWQAYDIDPEAAMRSASWGLGQIMGFNHVLAGWPSVQKMIEAFADDEECHLQAMVTFIIKRELDDEIRRHDWAGFARGYNGASYAANGYHTKLANRFAHWKRIRDTPYNGETQ